ncbi:MAG TPA: hypothetical protein VKB41_05095 [Steroidobacteraceae bacterium]|nr:hypothetical protein [Steroidobacteraceae bacterium]
MAHLHLILYVAALVLFLLAAWPVDARGRNLIALGLAALTLTLIV